MNPKRNKKKVFIASSREAINNKSIQPIIRVLEEHNFEPVPWYEAFPNGEFIMERLINITAEVDFAIFYFGEDIKFMWREKEQVGTAWNVVLEYGMFLLKLGMDRVRIIQEGNAHIPTDLGGLLVGRVDVQPGNLMQDQIKEQARKIALQWKEIPSVRKDIYGISEPIVEHKNELDILLNAISRQHRTSGLKSPLRLDEKLIVNLYLKGLENVQRKFWTTTYLSSGFWVHKPGRILSANERMLERLNKNKSKDVKRLFLLRREFAEEIEILGKKLVDYKNRKGGEAKLRELRFQFNNLRESCKNLKAKGCEIRFAHDNKATYHYVQQYINPEDTEIAVYDDFRIDFFEGGKNNKITGLMILAEFHNEFREVKDLTEKYFTQLWNSSEDIEVLLNSYEEKFNVFEKKVDYTLKKLLLFDNDLDTSDANLKESEMSTVLNYLKSSNRFDRISNSLDIGTCTGRYPFELKKHLRSDCRIWGIDADPDCIEYIDVKKKIIRNNAGNVENVFFFLNNFLHSNDLLGESQERFDLITCMLGTTSHFGWDIKDSDQFDDSLQFALARMKSFLSDDGVLILSNWTAHGLSKGMLSIYNDNDKKLLATSTEKNGRLKRRLELLGLKCEIQSVGPEHELDLFVCTQASLKQSKDEWHII